MYTNYVCVCCYHLHPHLHWCVFAFPILNSKAGLIFLARHNEGQDAPHCHGQVVVHVGGF